MTIVNALFHALPILNTALLAFGLYVVSSVPATQPQLIDAHSRISQLETRQTNQLQYAEGRINSLASSLDAHQNETQRRFKVLESRISASR